MGSQLQLQYHCNMHLAWVSLHTYCISYFANLAIRFTPGDLHQSSYHLSRHLSRRHHSRRLRNAAHLAEHPRAENTLTIPATNNSRIIGMDKHPYFPTSYEATHHTFEFLSWALPMENALALRMVQKTERYGVTLQCIQTQTDAPVPPDRQHLILRDEAWIAEENGGSGVMNAWHII